MKKLSNLTADQLFDVLFSLSPVLLTLKEIDVDGMIGENADRNTIVKQILEIIPTLIPVLTHKENRSCIYDLLAILEETTVEDIKNYPAPKLVYKIKQVFVDGELLNFLSYREE